VCAHTLCLCVCVCVLTQRSCVFVRLCVCVLTQSRLCMSRGLVPMNTHIHKCTQIYTNIHTGRLFMSRGLVFTYIHIYIHYIHTGKTVYVKGSGPKPYELKYDKVRIYANVSCLCLCLCLCCMCVCVCVCAVAYICSVYQ